MFKNTLKRLGAIVLALAMAMSVMAVTAFAEDTTPTLAKEYTKAGKATVTPSEELSFSVKTKTATDLNVDSPYYGANGADIPDITLIKDANASTFTIGGVDQLQGIGNFTYTLTENDANTAGVTYSTDEVTVNVVNSYKVNADNTVDTSTIVQNVAVGVKGVEGKIASITNTFTAGSLTIDKVVTGALGDKQKGFDVVVTLTAPTGKTVRNNITYSTATGTVTIAPNQWSTSATTGKSSVAVTVTVTDATSVTFNNIPSGVAYEVAEADYTSDGYDAAGYDNNKSGTITSTAVTTTITNNKNASTPTGVIMNIAPYVLMVALAGGIAFFFLRRRNAE